MKSRIGKSCLSSSLAIATCGLLVAACGPIDQADELTVNPLIGGSATSLRPEVGVLRSHQAFCTATLIADNVIVTAAHCFHFSNELDPNASVTFTAADGTIQMRSIVELRLLSPSAGSSLITDPARLTLLMPSTATPDKKGNSDVAVARLKTPIGNITPARLSIRAPNKDEVVTTFGFGCTDSVSQEGGGAKQKISWKFQTDRPDGSQRMSVLCSGDSGGGAFLGDSDAQGELWGVNSMQGFNNTFGNVSWYYDEILATMKKFQGGEFFGEFSGVLNASTRFTSSGSQLFDVSATLNQCRSLCLADGMRCQGYSVRVIDQFGGDCLRFKNISGFVASATSFSNVPGEDAEFALTGFEFPDTARTAASSIECRSACGLDSTCRGYTFSQGVCRFKSAISGRTSSTGSISQARSGIDWQTEHAAHEYSLEDLPSSNWDLCRQKCAQDMACKAFTYRGPRTGLAKATCSLRDGKGPAVSAPGATSGLKHGLEPFTDRPGSTFTTITFPPGGSAFDQMIVPQRCQSACANDSRCKSFTYFPSVLNGAAAHCDLKNAIPARVESSLGISGVKGAEFF
jgi:hypothetical protein